MAEPIDMPFGIWTQFGPSEAFIRCIAHWCCLANTIELSMCDGDVPRSQITLIVTFYTMRINELSVLCTVINGTCFRLG